MANSSQGPSCLRLGEIVKLYPKVMFLDQSAFGDVVQLLLVRINEGLVWETPLYNFSAKFSLYTPIQQVDQNLISVLNKVRVSKFDEDVITFINSRTVLKSDLLQNCLRLYTTRSEPICVPAFDIYNGGNRKSASHTLKETRLLQELQLKPNMPVMLIQDLQIGRGWVNGTLAKVTEIDDENILLVKQGEEELDCFYICYGNSQSITINSVAIHLDHMPSHGQLYVAMSRVRKADDLYLFGTDIPVRIKRKFGVNLDAIDMIDYSEQKHQRIQ
ncbi:hypothetical protein AB4K20DRAFT_1835701 [Rhizopus microsporus]|uniref:DNA helicase Pif1-like 2B domain-containing protein n=1 Tax=Rhizopus microsporus TaxID=58291 RepID=A0A1X0S171_RHIZD|nr:hypothetical protein BCV71DRAFT_264226 [Rhizopus microsporus]